MTIIQRFVKSLYSPKDIAKYRFLGIGRTILYVFLLMLLSTIPSLYHLSKMSIQALNEGKQIFMDELPPFIIENGELTSNERKPIIIKKDGFDIIFDSTGQTTENDVRNHGNAIALLKDEFFVVNNQTGQNFSYSTFQDKKMENKDIDKFLTSIHGVLWIVLPIIFVFLYLFTAALGFIKVSIFAGIGVLIAQALNRKLQYRQSWRLAAHSITLPTVFFFLMDAIKTVVPGGLFINWIVCFIMLYLSIREIPQPKMKA
ncbi:DUF1189 domain-containing protein [Heyndrickxia oleronia]|uniref:DUF1189 domain-containing protein n=1 Tax=Heyndrickxia oleronia TaxID=38875 RepID=UPI001B287F98|nr:DUF1189 domain-containing protein [Heyndrickxia oleronia]GIN38514.1 hypothetical protein J19TS1_14630 [Heyndrickxia oleronia]